jgi:type II secretory ATPase GspE/PulE/Tfp pilus assembly ATPase PilB-like protein
MVNMAESLIGVATQRLLRRVCWHCRAPDETSPSDHPVALRQRLAGRPLYRLVGCAACRGSGYFGRLPADEILLVDEDVSSWIALGTGRHALNDQILKPDNHVSLLHVCARRLLEGHTTLAEFERVFGVIDQRFSV